MEAEPLVLPDNTVIDPTKPPSELQFPKPDFSEVEQPDGPDKNEPPLLKPTFKNVLQAKKRLQAFSTARPTSLPSSPHKTKPEEKEEVAMKKPTRKGHSHDDKAKAVIKEIEELKKEEQAYLELQRQSYKRSRSRSRSTDKGRFKKVAKKSRNYRRRSLSPERPRKSPKKQKRYPRNWREFYETGATFEVNREFDIATPSGNNELIRQVLFESPSLPIVPFKMKTVNREDKIVPFEYIRWSRTKPVVPYSVNFGAVKQIFLAKKPLLDALPKHAPILEKLFSISAKFAPVETEPNKPKLWYPKIWTASETECKVLEKSMGLSFLQSYTGEEEENDEESRVKEEKPGVQSEEKDDKKKHKKDEERESSDEKKKKKKHKEKDASGEPKKKKKDKKKVEKRPKEKKKRKKPKEKKKEKTDKPTKQQVIEELKEIEEKLAKKREDKEKKEKKKHSEEDKKPKHDEPKVEHALKNKLKKMEANPPKPPKKEQKDVVTARKKKTRWSEEDQLSTSDLKIVEEIAKSENEKFEEDLIEEIKANTPDTDEYHSHWESDDDVSSSVPRNSLKLNRSWESDEELFERSHNHDKKPAETYANLEIPLNINIKSFSRRSWEEKPFSVVEELKLLEKERKCLTEERKKLELEKQKILQLQEEAKLDRMDDRSGEDTKDNIRLRSPFTPDLVKIKKEKPDDFSIDSLNNSLLSNVSSTESNFPVGVLENEYEEFIKAVSSETVPTKKKERVSSDSSSSWSSDSDHKKKKRKRKKKKKKKSRECDGLLLGKSNIFNEFDIPVPSDLPEMVPTPIPVPVPSPIVPLEKMLPLTPLLVAEKPPETPKSEKKPFVFSSIVLPSKKTPLVDNSNLKLDDSDSSDFTDKFVKKPETTEPEEKSEEKPPETVEPEATPDLVDIQNVPLPPEKPTPTTEKIKSRSLSPSRKPKPKRRSRSSSRDRDSKRRSPIRRRDPTPPHRRRHASPRRRSSPRRRGSPWRRSPSPRRRSPRRRRRSPSFSPVRSRNGRKRTPSPRRRASPLNSPLDGFKKSVADSTISDDMLPQLNPDDYSDSPNSYANKYYGKKKGSLSPQTSPKRISLDDRINQVLGLEKNDGAPPMKSQDVYQNYNYGNAYGQYPTFNQYGPKNEYMAAYPTMMYTQPPPPIAKPVATPTKVLQVGNILQVVPTDEVPVLETKTPERSQQIVQVGNMLQIVPAVISTPKQVPEPQPVTQPVPIPEKPSAEALMKQKNAERKAEREKRRQERDRRRKEKEQKRKEREKRKQIKHKLKTENMIKRAIQIETEALANDEAEEEGLSPITPVPVIVSTPPSCKSILLQGGSKKRKSVQFADGVRPGEGTSPSGGEELSSPPPPKLPKEKRYKKKTKKRKVRVKVVKKVQNQEEEEEDDDEDNYYANMPPPPPPPGSPPPHVFPARVKTHTINNVHPYVGNIMQSNSPGFPFPPPMQVVMNSRHQPSAYLPGAYPTDVNSLSHPTYQGVSTHH